MPTLTWTDALALNAPRMDDTHREFVDLLATLEATAAAPGAGDSGTAVPPAAAAAVDAALEALTAHTVEHFAQEERWMAALGFAAENCHAFQHAAVLNVLREVQRLYAAERDGPLVQRLAAELAQWFPAHAQTMDAALAQTMAERGYDPDRGTVARPPAPDTAPITSCGSAACH